MLKTVPEIRSDARAVLELPLAAIADYPGTVAVIDRYGTPSIAIGTASLVEVLQAAGRWPELVAASARVMVNGVAAIVVLADGPDNPIEATLLPLSGTQVLALLRPLDFEKALLRSLVESRQRYKDLIEIVSDFTWETDDEGCFTFISPRGALDWPASELVGRPPAPGRCPNRRRSSGREARPRMATSGSAAPTARATACRSQLCRWSTLPACGEAPAAPAAK
jgi:PAS domain-containing protein